MKRYLLFTFGLYPCGGWGDYHGGYSRLKDILIPDKRGGHVVDTKTGEVIYFEDLEAIRAKTKSKEVQHG